MVKHLTTNDILQEVNKSVFSMRLNKHYNEASALELGIEKVLNSRTIPRSNLKWRPFDDRLELLKLLLLLENTREFVGVGTAEGFFVNFQGERPFQLGTEAASEGSNLFFHRKAEKVPSEPKRNS